MGRRDGRDERPQHDAFRHRARRRGERGGQVISVRRRRAFTITELLISLGVLALFANAAGQLFQATMRVGDTAARQQDAAGRFEFAVTVLRNDVWAAGELAAPDAHSLRLGAVTW